MRMTGFRPTLFCNRRTDARRPHRLTHGGAVFNNNLVKIARVIGGLHTSSRSVRPSSSSIAFNCFTQFASVEMTIHRSSTMTSSNTTDDEPPALNAAAVPIDNDSSPPPPQLRSMHDKSTATPIIFTTSTATQTAAARAAAPAAPNKAVGGGGGGCCSADGCVRNLSYQVSNTLGELFYR